MKQLETQVQSKGFVFEISRTTSAIIRSAKLELEYAKFKGQNPEIEFLKVA